MKNLTLKILRVFLIAGLLTMAILTIRPSTPVQASLTQTFYASSWGTVYATDADYATAHDAATGTVVNGSTFVTGQLPSDPCEIYRSALWFDTSGLPDDAVVSSATFTAEVKIQGTTDFDMTVVNGSVLGASPLVAADYATLHGLTTSWGATNTSTAVEGSDFSISFNAAGLAGIQLAADTVIGLRSAEDIFTSEPTGDEFLTLDYTPTLPRLTITYTSNPTIQTNAATSVTLSTARLNAIVTSGGGDSNCYVRFQYGLTAAYGTNTPWVGGYSTGDTPYVVVFDLADNTTYHFRAQIYNAANGILAPASGLDATLSTPLSTSLGRPLNLSIVPLSATELLLTWEKNSSAYMTKVQYSLSGYPIDYSSGTTAYFGELNSAVLESLSPGTTYYFSAWSFTPNDNITEPDYWSDYEPQSLDYVADAGTNTTTLIDTSLAFTDDQYYRNCLVHNITAGDEERVITSYDGATQTCTLSSAIAGQTDGDQYYIVLRCDAAGTTLSSSGDWTLPTDSDAFNEPVTTHLDNWPMHEIVEMWCTISGMDVGVAWVFWGMIVATMCGVAVALVSESALITILTVVVVMAGGYFLGVFALWIAIMYIVLSVPVAWALAKW